MENQVDSIQADYELLGGGMYCGTKHGGPGGILTEIPFESGEVIMKMTGKTNNVLVDQVTFTTIKSDGSQQEYGPYGKTGQTPFEVDRFIYGFFGRSGTKLDALGVFEAQ